MVDAVLVPMDGSPLSFAALEAALSEYADSEIEVLHVIDPTEPGYSYPVEIEPNVEPLHGSEEWYERAEELTDELYERVEDRADDYDTEVRTETEVGRPERVIVDYAEDAGVDTIVIGSHGREEESRVLLGSTAEAVAFRSPVRVLLVR